MEPIQQTEEPRKRGRPAGSSNKSPAGSLQLSTAEILSVLNEVEIAAGNETPAILKEPRTHPGTNGKANSGLIYCPSEWIGAPVISLKISREAAGLLKANSLKREAETVLNKTNPKINKPGD